MNPSPPPPHTYTPLVEGYEEGLAGMMTAMAIFNDYYKIEIVFFFMLSRTFCLFLKQASLLNAWLASVS